MTLSRRAVLKHGLALGSLAPFATGFAASGSIAPSVSRQVSIYGPDRASHALGRGFSRKGWQTDFAGRLDVLELSRTRPGRWVAGFADDAELVLLTSLAAGRGRIVALGRHGVTAHAVRSWAPEGAGSYERFDAVEWQRDLGELYAELADESIRRRTTNPGAAKRDSMPLRGAHEQSFLIRI